MAEWLGIAFALLAGFAVWMALATRNRRHARRVRQAHARARRIGRVPASRVPPEYEML